MKVSLNWLKQCVPIDQTPSDLAEMLTMAGLEVEGIQYTGKGLSGVAVARILDISPHPQADRLSICQVSTGSKEVPVVCGAANIEKGNLVPLALPGTRLPDGTLLKETKIRGEVSYGMLLAEDEMGLTDDHTGIMILPDDLSPGQSLPEAMDVEDCVLDIALTPNRVDCASVVGIAREIAALTGRTVTMPEVDLKESNTDIAELASVNIVDSQGCPRYTAGLIDKVNIGPSPFWMRYRLHLSGIRAINNVVDVTNYVLMELGQPLHAFDYHRLAGRKIVVQRAKIGQIFTTLDGVSRDLDDQILMICDGERPVALAGIMGGLNSEITPSSAAVLIESAYFDPITIRRSSKKLSLSTEASYRFERGIDIEGVDRALRRSLMLIGELAGGSVARGIIDCYPEPWSPPKIIMRVEKTNEILGVDIDKEVISRHLSSLGMAVRDTGDKQMEVKPPPFRIDLTREADLIEEVARLIGYDNIPVTLPAIRAGEEDTTHISLRDRIRTLLVGMGFSEVITYSFISPQSIALLGADEQSVLHSFVKLLNPLSLEQSVMRTSLIPGLLSSARLNTLRGQYNLRIFEWGTIYLQGDEELPKEKQILAALITGRAADKQWYQAPREVDFFDIKGAAEHILDGLGIEEASFSAYRPKEGFEPTEYANILFHGSEMGTLGRISKKVITHYELEDSAYLLELDIEALLLHVVWTRRFTPIAKFPSVRRDISLIVSDSTESAALIGIVKEMGKDLIEDVNIFDVYRGKGIDSKEKAVAITINYRSKDRTLTDEEVNRIHEEVIAELRYRTGARLREG
ncbi:MAG: phenylalanine--tRNA ligase subunit beta [Thermodesulfobacteriota bacterium]